MDKRKRIVVEAKKSIGVPYLHKGNSNRGLNCIGLIQETYKKSGINVVNEDKRDYKLNWWIGEYEDERYLNGLFKAGFRFVMKPKIGDIILFKLFGDNNPFNHSGILIDIDNYIFIHASNGIRDKKVKIDYLYPKYLLNFYKFLCHRELLQ